MDIPILHDESFIAELRNHSSLSYDKLLDQMIESLNESYLKICDQSPDAQVISTYNSNRIAMTQLLKQFKTTNLTLPEE